MPLNQQNIIPFGSVADGFNSSAQEMLEARSLGRGRPLTELAAPFEVRAPGDGKIYQRNGADNAWDFIGFESQPYWGAPRPGIFIEGFELAYGDYPNNTFTDNKLFSVKPGRIFIAGDGPIARLTNGVIEYYPEVEQDFLRKAISKTAAWSPGQGQPGSVRDPEFFHGPSLSYPFRITVTPVMAVFLIISETTGALDLTYGPLCVDPILLPASDRHLVSYEVTDFRVDLPDSIINAAGGPWRMVCRLGYLPLFDNGNDFGVVRFFVSGNKTDVLEPYGNSLTALTVFQENSQPNLATDEIGVIWGEYPPNVMVDLHIKFPEVVTGEHKLYTVFKNANVNRFPQAFYSPVGAKLSWAAVTPNGINEYSINLSIRSSIYANHLSGVLTNGATTRVSRQIEAYLTVPSVTGNPDVNVASQTLGWDDYTIPRIPFRVSTI